MKLLRAGLCALYALLIPFRVGAAEPAPATARPFCHDHAEIARQLAARYEETPISLGLQANGDLLQVFASAKSGTWTILSTSPDGRACILAAGQRWESVKPPSLDPEA